LDQRTFFFCASSDSGFEELGSAKLTPGGVELPLLLPEKLAEQLRKGDWHSDEDTTDALEARADSLADAAEAMADSADTKAAKAQALNELRSRLGDSLRAEGLRRADSVRHSLKRMADSLNKR
jgi:non-ribosomal peptide synthetase component E (peptide arylation enzyme)